MEGPLLRVLLLVLCSSVVMLTNGSDDVHTYVVAEGESLSAICNVTVEPDLFVYWARNDTGSLVQNGTDLVLPNISRASAGVYVCHRDNETMAGDDTIVEAIYVDVQYPATVTNMTVTPATTMENETFTVTCVVDGNPAPEYWIGANYNHVLLAHGVSVGTITATRLPTECTDTSAWFCSARNQLNTGNATTSANATVYCAPRPRPGMEDQYIVLTYIGTQAIFIMNYISNPTPNMTWEHEGRVLESSFNTDSAPSGFVALNETSLRLEDFLSNYSLTMENNFGSHVAEYRLISYGQPFAPTDLHATDIGNDSATMVWTSGFDMGTEQHFILMEHQPAGGYIQMRDKIYVNYTNRGVNQTCSYHLDRLDSGTRYQLAIIAQTKLFTSEMSPPTNFTTEGHPPPPMPSPSSGSKTGIIVGSSVGGVAFVALVVLGMYYMKRRSKQRISYNKF